MSRERLGEALRQLYLRVPLGMRLGLAPMQAACERAGHPERSFESVHVAGTNGKGSVSAMTEAIVRAMPVLPGALTPNATLSRSGPSAPTASLRDAASPRGLLRNPGGGVRTGLFTSPHLTRFAERIRVNGEPIDDGALCQALEEALTVGADLSFFETATLAAFLAFRNAGVEIAVLEVGIGGRLDATNVIVAPRATAITKVAFDHQDKLGNTLAEIAREKAGIAKAGVPMVVGTVTEEARRAIERACYAVKAKAEFLDDERIPKIKVSSPLPGLYQSANVRVASRIGVHLGADEATIARGLATAKWPGRFETIEHASGAVLLDAAHNPDGMLAFIASLSALRSRFPADRCALVFGALADKEWSEMIDLAAKHFEHRVYTVPKGRAAVRPDTIRERHAGIVEEDPVRALATARGIVGEKGLVVVCGSIFLVGELRGYLLGIPADPAVAL